MAGQTQWKTKVVRMAWNSWMRHDTYEMDMDDKTTWMTDLKTSKTVSTVWCKQWLMKQRTEVEFNYRCSMNDKAGYTG